MSMGSQRISMVLIAALIGATASTVLAQGRLPTFRIMMIADGESPVFQQRQAMLRPEILELAKDDANVIFLEPPTTPEW